MNFEGFLPHEITRFGGLVDSDDPTVLPIGVAALCKNCRFQLTSVATRYGLQAAMRSPNPAPISGLASLIYTPENPGDVSFEVPMVFDRSGALLIEAPAGSGNLHQVQGPLVDQPQQTHAMITECYNRALIAFSDLKQAKAPIEVYGLKTQKLDPYGQKPIGAGWGSTTGYLVNEYVQPTASNSHLYQCVQSGVTGTTEPKWPGTEGGTVADGSVLWREHTPVLANRLPPPNPISLKRDADGGSFSAGRDVYVKATYVNAQGESVSSDPATLNNTAANDAVQLVLPNETDLPGWIQELGAEYSPTALNIYEADVAAGGPAPQATSYALAGSFGFGTVAQITTSATGNAPPENNTARITPSGLEPPPTPTVERAPGEGLFPAGRDVYVISTATNMNGETLPSVAGVLLNTLASDGVTVSLPATQFLINGFNVYEADVPTGSPAPDAGSYALAGSFPPNSTATITETATGTPPPTANSTGDAGAVSPDAGGLRYASIAFTNRNGNLSGTVPAFTSVDVDMPGFSLYMANIPIGPENVINRTVSFSIADGTSAGPFYYIPSNGLSSGQMMTSTVIPDNTTTTGFFNFTDEYLEGGTATDTTDRLRVIQPPSAVDLYYAPSMDRVVLTGVDGYASGHYISLAADSESFYGDTSPIQVANGNGQRCICAREFQGTLYSLKERSGFVISPTASDPATWSVQQRWEGVGPCGPRAVAVTSEFLFFVHRSGAYIYTPNEPQPVLVTKELPNLPGCFWSTINWDAEETIWCSADEENKEVRVGLPVGTATSPNVCLTMNYMEGLAGPIHFSPYVGNEIATGEARKWSLDDIAGFTAIRCERTLPANGSPFGSQRQSQILIASSAPDGLVHAVTPGVYNDNGSGIDCQYETVCGPGNMAVSMLGGITLNAVGSGAMDVSVLMARSSVTASGVGDHGPEVAREIRLAPFRLTPDNWRGYSGGARGQNERFRCRFTNNNVADAWFGLKYASLFTRPLFTGRTGS